MRCAFIPIVLLAVAGCVSTNAVMLGPNPVRRAPVLPTDVRIYRTPEQVKGKYEEVALLHSTGDSDFSNEREMIQSMQKKAGELGANGIILDVINEASAGAKVAGAIFGTGSERKGRSVAIFVFPDSAKR